ncbi:FMN-binding domain-containing protein [Maledivibacter halophilus]|uniref:FMN-binding domain-containing protein n=2 Tax=Maledivibacter halophilus TaxID=36842 RepID=A0A1T5JCV6_9FIRM|nr:FMN-binding domain-containing protein [Maledivibacter halophilus]
MYFLFISLILLKEGKTFKNIKFAFSIMIIVFLLSSCDSKIHKEVNEVIQKDQTVNRLSEYEDDTIYGVYHVTDGKKEECIQLVSQKGFVDEIKMMVIIDFKEDEIKEIKILSHNESQDYGALLTEKWFLERFKGRETDDILNVVKMSAKEESQIVAITGATITSEGVVKGVNQCINNYKRVKGE